MFSDIGVAIWLFHTWFGVIFSDNTHKVVAFSNTYNVSLWVTVCWKIYSPPGFNPGWAKPHNKRDNVLYMYLY